MEDIPADLAERYRALDLDQQEMGIRWQEYHGAFRDRLRNEVSVILIAHRACRLHRLQLAFEEAVERRNTPLAASILEQAAKEMGNWFVRRQN